MTSIVLGCCCNSGLVIAGWLLLNVAVVFVGVVIMLLVGYC